MLMIIIQILLILALFIPVSWLAYMITEVWGLPKWLQYRPWQCCLCLTFWTLLVTYITVGVVFSLPITLWGGIALTVLNAIAMYINQRNKTIKVE